MPARAAVALLIVLTAGALAALGVGLAALAGADVATTTRHFEPGVGPHLRPAVLLPIVYVAIPALCTVAAAAALVRSGRFTRRG
jgi:hypothetical protein